MIIRFTDEFRKKYKKLETKLKESVDISPEEKAKIEVQIAEHKKKSNLYDKKQLPLKILANSWFGSYGAPYIFNWGDTDSAEETTCRGRQYLRLMVRHFTEKYGFRPLVMDTDGCNLAAPDNIDTLANGNVAINEKLKSELVVVNTLPELDTALAIVSP